MDVPDTIREHVPDTLAIVEYFRDCKNMDYGADMHGAAGVPEFVLGLISQDQFDHRQLHELYQMNRAVDEVLEEALTTWNTAADGQKAVTGATTPRGCCPGSRSTTRRSGTRSAIRIQGSWVTGSRTRRRWAALDDGDGFRDEPLGRRRLQPGVRPDAVLGYVTAIQKMAQYAVQNSDTPHSDGEFEATVETGGLSTAYITTDALTRSSDQIIETDGDTHPIERDTETVALEGSTTHASVTVPSGTHMLSVFVKPATPGFVRATLLSPDGSAFTGSQTNTVDITVGDLTHDATITDHFPEGWEVQSEYFDVTGVDDGNNIVEFGTVSADDVADESVTRTYAIEASEEETKSNAYDFGPAEAISFIDDQGEHDTFAGTDTNVEVESSTNQ